MGNRRGREERIELKVDDGKEYGREEGTDGKSIGWETAGEGKKG